MHQNCFRFQRVHVHCVPPDRQNTQPLLPSNVCVRINVTAANNLYLNYRDLFAHSLVSLTSLYKVQVQMAVRRNFIEVDKKRKKIMILI